MDPAAIVTAVAAIAAWAEVLLNPIPCAEQRRRYSIEKQMICEPRNFLSTIQSAKALSATSASKLTTP